MLFRSAEAPIFVVGMWLVVATTVKRLHDRNRSGWWIIPFFVVPPLFYRFDDLLGDSWAAFFLGLAVIVLCLWGFIELLFLRGTRGPNRFGPDRLAPHDTGPGWAGTSKASCCGTNPASNPTPLPPTNSREWETGVEYHRTAFQLQGPN